MRAFLREEKAPRPFLLELPVALTLYGSIEQFESFCAGMQSSDLFLGIRAFALTALPPEVLTADEQGRLTNGTLRFELVCNGFYQF